MSGKTVKAPSWQPQKPPAPEECMSMWLIVRQAVASLRNEGKEPVSLGQIFSRAQWIVGMKRTRGEWEWPYRVKRTWDRRVNEAATKEVGMLIATTAGTYKLALGDKKQ